MNETVRCASETGEASNDALGLRLRRARERMQLSISDVAAKLKMSRSLVDALEHEDFSHLGAPVYVRGYLLSYVRLVNLPAVVVDAAVRNMEVAALPPLRSAVHVSPVRHFMDRYAMRSVYVILTASILVPIVWLAVQRPLILPLSAVRSLDAPFRAREVVDAVPEPPQVRPVEIATADLGPVARPAVKPSDVDEFRVIASLAPFYPAAGDAPPLVIAAAPAAKPTDESSNWSFAFVGESWVEILDRSGSRVAFGLQKAGSRRVFPTASISRVALGDAAAVEVRHHGQLVDLAPFRRAKVARFAISSNDKLSAVDNAR